MGFSIAAFAHIYDALYSWSDSPAESIAAAHDSASKAVELDPRDAMSLAALGTSEIYLGKHDDAIARLQTAVALNPSFPWAHGDLGVALLYAGRGEEAVVPVKEAIRLSPRDTFNFLWLYVIGFAYFISGRYEDGLEWTGKSLQENPNQPGAHRIRAVCLSQLGRIDEAKESLTRFRSYAPDTTIGSLRSLPFKNSQDLEHYLDSLRMAGLPD